MSVDHCQLVADDWRQNSYYALAESPEWMHTFWKNEAHPFKRMFSTLDQRVLIELACGHGRHSAYVAKDSVNFPNVQHWYLLDVNQENVTFCRQRFAGIGFNIYRNNGRDFRPIKDGRATAIFCYDAMVHFEYDTVISYIQDAERVLAPGGRALFHHSNYDKAPGTRYSDNPSGRNFMSKTLFAHVALRAGFEVVEQVVMTWDRVPDTDCVTLLEKA